MGWISSRSIMASAGLAGILLLANGARAQDATWTGGVDGDWTNGGNWSTGVVPTGIATLDGSTSVTTINLTDQYPSVDVGEINVQAPGYNIEITASGAATYSLFTINGAGVQSSLANRPTFSLSGTDTFDKYANLYFAGSATAGHAHIVSTDNALLAFLGNADGGDAVVDFNGYSSTWFNDSSKAGNAIFSGGDYYFNGDLGYAPPNVTFDASADNGTFTLLNGYGAAFFYNSSGGQSRFILEGISGIDISTLTSNGTTFGSLEGAGDFVGLGSKNIEVGGTNRSTTLAARFLEAAGGAPDVGGSLTKVGTGTFTLTGDSSYSGGTKIEGGAIVLGDGSATSATGSIIGDVAMSNNTTFGFDRADTALQIAGLISGAGKVVQMGSGETTLTNPNNSYSDGTFLNAGKLSASSDGNLGTASGALNFNGGTLKVTGQTYAGTDRTINWGASGGGFEIVDAANKFVVTKGIAGGGPLSMTGPGTLVLSGTNSYGATTINSGTLQVGNGGATGTLGGSAVLNNGALVFDRDATAQLIVANAISGSGSVTQQGAGTTILTADSNYTGGTTVTAGTLQLGNGGASGSIEGDVSNSGTLAFARSGTYQFDGKITGSGNVTQMGPGTTVLSGSSAYTGLTNVNDGTLEIATGGSVASGQTSVANGAHLQVDGKLTAPVSVNGSLQGEGTIGGASNLVEIKSGGNLNILDNNNGIQKLTIEGDLTVNSGGNLNYNYGVSPNLDTDVLMVDVGGDVKLGGNLTVACTPPVCGGAGGVAFDPGTYGLIKYGGMLDTTGMATPILPAGFSLQTSVSGQVNLVYAGDLFLDYWYGDQTFEKDKLKGGDGVWTATKVNWTDKDAGAAGKYDNTSVAMFQGSAGTVHVDNSAGQIIVAGMQFTVDGYTITDGAISLGGPQGQTRITTGNNNADSVHVATTLEVVLQDGPSGPSRLVKDDLGTLVLTKANSYSGGTTIDDGTLQISRDENLGANGTDITFDGGSIAATLQNTKAMSTNRPVIMDGLGGTFQTDANMTLNNAVSGAGALTKTGAATLILGADNSYGGGTVISQGILQVGDPAINGGESGTLGGGPVTNNAALVFNRSDALIVSNAISGSGGVTQAGGGTTILTANNSYSGGTTVSQGTLQLGNGGGTGNVASGMAVAKGATLAFDRSDSFVFNNAITGEGSVHQMGSGTTIFNTAQAYSGPTLISDGALQVNRTLASAVEIEEQGTLSGIGTMNGSVTNAGTIEPGTGGMGQALTISGAYVGKGGKLTIHSVLGTDNSPTNRLVIQGAASGTTGIVVVNEGGDGDFTTGDGIPIVVAANGGTIQTGSFHLARPVVAGPYEYLLYQGTQTGGGTVGEEQSYYLRNETNNDVPTYSPTVPMHSALASMSRQQDLTVIGTFHERNGDQGLVSDTGERAAWGRMFGAGLEERFSGAVHAKFDGDTYGMQTGTDIYRWTNASGHQDRLGVFFAYAKTSGDVSGFVLGQQDRHAGDVSLEGTSFGGTWTHLAPSGWYSDFVLMGTRFEGSGSSVQDTGVSTRGYGVAASLEGGYPVKLGGGMTLEPQAQIVYTHTDINRVDDPFSDVDYNTPDAAMGRLGFRLSADQLSQRLLRPYLKANLWQDFTPTDRIAFDDDQVVKSRNRATMLEMGGGLVWQFKPNAGLWVDAAYTRDIAGDRRTAFRGDVGVRVGW